LPTEASNLLVAVLLLVSSRVVVNLAIETAIFALLQAALLLFALGSPGFAVLAFISAARFAPFSFTALRAVGMTPEFLCASVRMLSRSLFLIDDSRILQRKAYKESRAVFHF
jgi:hypothetical protein